MNTNTLFAVAAILVGAGYFVRSLPLAVAFPQGPNVSLGSNPIQQFSATCPSTIMSTGSQELIITDVVVNPQYYGSDGIVFSLQTGALATIKQGNNVVHLPLESGIRVPSNETLSCDPVVSGSNNTNNRRDIFISGYYAQP